MFRVKICGITTVKDAQFAALAGADASGLNFYSGSSRFVDLNSATQICRVVPKHVTKVGVFVKASPDEVLEKTKQLGLNMIQLHGDEPVEYLQSLSELSPVAEKPWVYALRLGSESFAGLAAQLESLRAVRSLAAVLVDARVADAYGGTGVQVDWAGLAAHRDLFGSLPLVLAGGLTPFNVAEAISIVRPTAVDVASGVENESGKKDLLLVRAFCNAANQALRASPS